MFIQVTTDKDHGINLEGLNAALRQLQSPDGAVLLWCVPPGLFDTFRWQNYTAAAPGGASSPSSSSVDPEDPEAGAAGDEGVSSQAPLKPAAAGTPSSGSGGEAVVRTRRSKALQPARPVRQAVLKGEFSAQLQQQRQAPQPPLQQQLLRRIAVAQARGPRQASGFASGRLLVP